MPTPTPPPRRTVARRLERRRPPAEPAPAAARQAEPVPAARPTAEAPPPERRSWLPALVLGVCAVVLVGLAVWFAHQAQQVRAAAGTNTALTDNAATSEANGQVAAAVNTLFSYNYNDLDKTQQAARGVLTGKAVCQYDQLFAVVRQHAPQQRLVVTVTVTNSGVEMLTGHRARVLVFATQSDTSTTTKQTATAGAMFAVDALRQDGSWKVENIDTFNGEAQTSSCR
jgi:Mce-associated membrane protein